MSSATWDSGTGLWNDGSAVWGGAAIMPLGWTQAIQAPTALYLYDHDLTLTGIVQGEVTVTPSLSDLATLSATIPRKLLTRTGAVASDQASAVKAAVYAMYDGRYYRVNRLTDDQDGALTLDAEDCSVDFAFQLATHTPLPWEYIGPPSEVGGKLLRMADSDGAYHYIPGGRWDEGRTADFDAPTGWSVRDGLNEPCMMKGDNGWTWIAYKGRGACPVSATSFHFTPSISLSSVAAADTVTINGKVFTAHGTTTTVATRTFSVAGTNSADADELCTCINDLTYGVKGVEATNDAGTITLTSQRRPTVTSSNGTHIVLNTAPARLESDPVPVTPGCKYHISVDYLRAGGSTGYPTINWRWVDLQTNQYVGPIKTVNLTGKSGNWTTYASSATYASGVTAIANGLVVWFASEDVDRQVAFHNVKLQQIRAGSGVWQFSSEKETVPAAECTFASDDPRLVYDASEWTLSTDYLSTTTQYATLTASFVGSSCQVYFASGHTAATTEIRVDGYLCATQGSGEGWATITSLGTYLPSHTLTIEMTAASGTCKLGGALGIFDVGTAAVVHVRAEETVLDALRQIQEQTGGFYEVDPVAKRVTLKAAGTDLTASNALILAKGNTISLTVETDTSEVANSLVLYGRPDTAGKLVLPYTATAEGIASEAAYGERWGVYRNEELIAPCQLWSAGKLEQIRRAPAAKTYTIEVMDEVAELVTVGDLVTLAELGVSVQVLTVERSSLAGTATITAGSRPNSAVRALERLLAVSGPSV